MDTSSPVPYAPSTCQQQLPSGPAGKITEKFEPHQNASTEYIVPSARQHWASILLNNAQKRRYLMSSLVLLSLFTIAWRTLYPLRLLHKKNESLCTEPACIHAASEILYNLAPNYVDIDPCTNFNTFVCGGWDDRHDLRPDQGDMFTGTTMYENSQTLLRHVLEAPYPKSSDPSNFLPISSIQKVKSVDKENFEKMKNVYNACMDEAGIEKAGLKPLEKVLKGIQELFHTSAYKDSQNVRIAQIISSLSRFGVEALVSLGVGADDKDPDTVVIQVSAPRSIGLPSKEYYKDSKIVKKYAAVVEESLELVPNLQILSGYDTTQSLAQDVVHMESLMAAASPDAEDANDVTKYYNMRSLKETEALLPAVSFSTIFSNLAPPTYEPEQLLVASPSYLQTMSEILEKASNSTVEAYLMWKTIQRYAPRVDPSLVKPFLRFQNELQGKDADATEERWRTCVREVDGALPWILSRFFVEKAFSEKARIFGDRIVSDIKAMFVKRLNSIDWMDKDIVQLAINKVHNIVQKIGYPTSSPNILDPKMLQKYYEPTNLSSSDYFGNGIVIAEFDDRREWFALGKPTDRAAWGMSAPTVNAYYDPAGNEIVFPAGIMQFPVFDVNVPEYLSYGAFGSVSGHELSHAFDSTGRHYDQNGNYTDWWNNQTVKAFESKAECFVDQYSNYTVPGLDGKPLHVNGKLTLGENIADAGGLTASFAAWKERDAAAPNQLLPGLEAFSKEQLFFISYANWWCGKTRKETAVNRIYRDPHAPMWTRILGTMANSRDFAESFNCPKREPTCELW